MSRSRSHRDEAPSVAASWRALSLSMRVLRVFLGVTFVYAGLQKLADPNFFHPGTPDYIGFQLRGFAQGSPIGPVLLALDRIPDLTGLGIALAEIAVGAGTLLGIAPFASAAGGFGINVALTLSATWHVHPYFLGSDSMYAVGWLAYLVGLWEAEKRRRRAVPPRKRTHVTQNEIGRRDFMRGGLLAGLSMLLGGAAKALSGPGAAASESLVRTAGGAGARSPGATATTAVAGPPAAQGTEIATLSQLPVGQAVGFEAPSVGPAVLVRLAQDKVSAYSRVCTHAGCLVGYNASTRILVCPCHGAEFDPAKRAAPITGPAPSPLAPIKVEIDAANGTVVLPS